MPPLLPVGFVCHGFSLNMQLRAQPNVLLLPEELIRVNAAGETEVFIARQAATAEEWGPVPPGMLLHHLGTPLPPEKCAVVILLSSAVVDTLGAGIVGLDGKPRQGVTSVVGHKVLAVVPLDQFQREHVENLRGPTG
jgi:hypothetical protein